MSESGSELITERQAGLKEPNSQSDSKHLQDEERGENVGDEWSLREDEKVSKGEGRESESEQSEVIEEERESKKRENKEEVDEKRETEVNKENMQEREKAEDEDDDGRVERGSAGVPGVERSIQVLDGHIALGSVQWRDCRATASGRAQV